MSRCRRLSPLQKVYSVMCRCEEGGGEAVAYLDLQIHQESRKPSGMK